MQVKNLGTPHIIPLESITSDSITKFGTAKKGIKIRHENGELHVPADETRVGKTRHHVYIPHKCKLPFRIDMTAKVYAVKPPSEALTNPEIKDVPPPELNLYIGNGKVHFEGGHISCNDILTTTKAGTVGDAALATFVKHSGLPEKDAMDISVMFGSQMMWVAVDGQYCYASDKMPYLAHLQNGNTPAELAEGLAFSICGGTHTKLTIKSLTITEYDHDEPNIPSELSNLPELTPFELYVNGLPPELHDEMHKTDAFLMNDMKSSLKFKRTIDEHGHLTYQAPCGLQYGMTYFGAWERHGTHWVQSAKKPDQTSAVLAKLAESSPTLADALFSNISICSPHARECKRRTTITYKGTSRQVCRGAISLPWSPSGFEDLRELVAAASEIVGKKQEA